LKRDHVDIHPIRPCGTDNTTVTLPIYDRERTICDCFKYRSKLDNEIFSKALKAYANDIKKNLNNLSTYAKKLRVYKKVTELMEVLLNG
jgi:predicted transcriptional regulator of viral defense system